MSNGTDRDLFVTMTGFAKRAGKIIYGYDNLQANKRIKMLAVSDTASDNLKSDMNRLAEKHGVPLVTVRALENTVGNNVKALGFTDGNMSKAAVEYARRGAPNYSVKEREKPRR